MFAWRSFLGWPIFWGMIPLFACGPFFPENALDKPKQVLQPPLFEFTGELYSLSDSLLDVALGSRKPGSPAYTLDLEMTEMETVMKARIPDDSRRANWLKAYRALRASMIKEGDRSENALQAEDREAAKAYAKVWDEQKVLNDLPEDIRLYLEGARLYLDAGDDAVKRAQAKWQQVLALPEAERKWRSTWAAWMLFRTAKPADDVECGRRLAEVRELSQKGFADCLHLGIEATYILGRAGSDLPEKGQVNPVEWKRAAYLRAILGHSRAEAQVRSDRWEQSAWSEELAAQTLADPFLRQAQLLHLIEVAQGALGWYNGVHGNTIIPLNDDLESWLKSYEKAEVKGQREAALLAWLYYNAARFSEAKRWVKMAPEEDVIALSIRGKLAAMEGKKQETVKAFAAVAKQMPEVQDRARADMEVDGQGSVRPLTAHNLQQVRRHHFLADYGTAQLAVNDFTGALATFSKTDYWPDTAYIAERLISVEELLVMKRAGKLAELKREDGYVVETPPYKVHSIKDLSDQYGGWRGVRGYSSMDYLIGRRLAREHYFKNAEEMLPEDLGKALEVYALAYRLGHDKKRSKAERAAALWKAAQMHKIVGDVMFGFAGGPDHFVCGCVFNLGNMASFRAQKLWREDWYGDGTDTESYTPVFAATTDEKWRARHYGPVVDKRYHFRYVAADLAWEAAALMPDDDPQTAEVLCIAGTWLKYLSPVLADRFYKSMVRRNPNVPLAQVADKKRWFPKVEWDYDLPLN